MYDLLQSGELDDKVVKVVGDIVYSDYTNPNTGETKTYTNYEANRIYVVKDDAPRVATSNMTLLIGEDAISDDELEETGVFKVSGYETVYVSREQPNKGVFKVLEYPLGIDDKEKMHKKFEIIKRLLRVEDCELAKIGFKVNLINRTEEVEFDESMLTDEEKEDFKERTSKFGILRFDNGLLDTLHTTAATALGNAMLSGDFDPFNSMLDNDVETILYGKQTIKGKESVYEYWKGWRERFVVTKDVTEFEVKHSNHYSNSCLQMKTMLVLFMIVESKIVRIILVRRHISGGYYTHHDDLVEDYPFKIQFIDRYKKPLREANEFNAPVN